jgi:GDP-L-fucose synthase
MSSISKEARILLTGASGGLGKALLNQLRAHGYSNVMTPTSAELNFLNEQRVCDYFEKHRPQVLFHLASTVFGLLGNLENQMRSLRENTLINAHIFHATDKYPLDFIFFAGTVASYPFPYKSVPLTESDFFDGLPHGGEFGYAMAKRHAYAFLKILQETKRSRFAYGIFTNLYGENDRFNDHSGHVIPSLIMKAYRAKQDQHPFEVWGDGKAERDFLHFDDAAKGAILCMENEATPTLINISSATATSIRTLAELISRQAGLSSIKFLTDKPVGIPVRTVNNSALTQLGFNQSVPIDEGIKRTFNWYANNVNTARS